MTEVHGASAPTADEVRKLLRQAAKGDKAVLPALQTLMDRSPSLWEKVGNLANTARQSLLETISGDNLLAQEAHARKCTALMEELAGPQPSPLERLLAERIALCWLHLYYAEALYAQNINELSLRQAEYYEQRLSKAQARYLAAIRTLAQIRRLGTLCAGPAEHRNAAGRGVSIDLTDGTARGTIVQWG
jgi:hypothetical protein